MTSVFDNPDAKKKCQIFTPTSVVIRMLDDINYKSGLYGKKVLDHSCGNGQFLKEVVYRYIRDCKEQGFPAKKIRLGLSQDIWGFELDEDCFLECIRTLTNITNEHGLGAVKWKIFNCDSLRVPIEQRFEYIIGNPPYLSYWDIPISERKFIRDSYDSCKNGACDYCFAFVECALSLLSDNGVLTYIIPSSIFKTRAAQELRNMIKPYVRSIYDYKTKKVFDNALTSSAIIILDKADEFKALSYIDITREISFLINKENLGDIWVFRDDISIIPKGAHRFGDYFRVSTSIATQYNKAFVLIGWEEDGTLLKGPNGVIVEKEATRKAASPKRRITKCCERIIFPYYYKNGKKCRYTENEYKTLFPFAYKYLLTNKDNLLKRDSDKKAAWFEYGRSQALDHLEQPKILLSSVITDNVNVFKLNKYEIPYSGMYIVPIGTLSADDGIRLLKADEFKNYVDAVGVHVNGNSMRITARNIDNYCW